MRSPSAIVSLAQRSSGDSCPNRLPAQSGLCVVGNMGIVAMNVRNSHPLFVDGISFDLGNFHMGVIRKLNAGNTIWLVSLRSRILVRIVFNSYP
jgi:hypothetical protein